MLPSLVSFLILFLATLPLGNLAAHHPRRRHPDRNPYHYHSRNNNPPYTLQDSYQGDDFFNKWDFFSYPDPTHGRVNYQTKEDAIRKGLAYVRDDGAFVMSVDDTNTVPLGGNRDSVRITSKRTYTHGLFIADFERMPHGCSVWPAFWSVGPSWPNGGEIDVVEGVHDQPTNQYTLHTSFEPGCSLSDRIRDSSKAPDGRAMHRECGVSPNSNRGCAFSDNDGRSYGAGFNSVGGGVFVLLWNSGGIYMWHFARSDIPDDIKQGVPDPTNWGRPAATWTSDSCNIDAHFYEHVLVINITLCGDWAAATYGDVGCPGTCDQAVTNPDNYHDAKWVVKSVKVYQPTQGPA
ncbi:hypothetical protein AX16_004682 [Volvariella volvacea WC 439]|nr:hypothetical protein AX16_004682 [Volvariella volvacea WC 439]